VIEALPLHPGGDPLAMARRVAAFLGEARESLDLALYDIRLPDEPGDVVASALCDAHERGVRVRVAYNADHPERIFFPPPPQTRPELLEAMPFATCGIPGIPDLMHHKYVVRDGRSVWTGSTNWTTDSWTLQENVVLTAVDAPELAAEFAQNFDELWTKRNVDASGHEEPRDLDLGGHRGRAWFTPGHGEELSHRIAKAIGRARERVRIASPVITAGPVLATLAEVASERRADLRAVVDRTQMEEVVHQWRTNGHSAWKIPILAAVLSNADFKGKRSTKYGADTPHDFMHAKITVADDVVFTGSFNLSRSGEQNAENVVEVHDAALADQLAAFVDEIRARYEAMPVPDGGRPTAAGHAPRAGRR
jgi:phosphatidylserine/phosphatidylglycerophosphate/cardiolipin synthase-like enzyme